MSEESHEPSESKGTPRVKQERIELGGIDQTVGTLTRGGGILEEPFLALGGSSIRDILRDAQSIANQTDRRVYFKFHDTIASVDKHMQEQFAQKEEELDPAQELITRRAKELRDEGYLVALPEESGTSQQKRTK